MKRNCEQLKSAYVDWLQRGLNVQAIDDFCELTTPFLDRHNDYLQVVAKANTEGKFVLSDDGYILSDLRASGAEISTPKRREILATILRGFGVREENHRLVVDATQRNLGQKVHALVQAMLAVNDMFVLAQPRVESLFYEDVESYLEENDVRFSPRVKITGVSGFDHAIDFLIPASRSQPERLVKAINNPSKNNIESLLFSLQDTNRARTSESKAFAVLNDAQSDIGDDIMTALGNYEVVPAPWSRRKTWVSELAA